jgi:hypothetical protein
VSDAKSESWSPIKPSQVLYGGADFHPTARCDDCGSVPMFNGHGVAKKWAKEHVAATGHEVVVDRVSRSVYYAPAPRPTGEVGGR